jgi:plastocyanin
MRRAYVLAIALCLSNVLLVAQTQVSGRVQLAVQHESRADSSSVVVWLQPLDAPPPKPQEQRTYRLTQKDKHFSPHLLVVPVGASVEFPNKDPFFHNVFSVYNGTRFDLGLYESGSSKLVKFSRPGPSYIFCNIHPEMSAVVLALTTPYYAVTNKAGDFTIDNVPAGKYELQVWAERAQPDDLKKLSRKIEVSGTQVRLDTMSIAAAPSMAEGHKNKFGHDYEPSPTYKLP